MQHVAHWDDVEGARREAGHIGGTWRNLGLATTREPNDIAYYPRSGKVSLRGVGVIGRIERLGYWDGEP